MRYPLLLSTLVLCASFAQAQTVCSQQTTQENIPEGLQNAAALASAGLEELAEDRNVSIDKVGAVLLLWNYPACDIYNDVHESGADIEMSERTKEKLQEKCRKVILLKPANRAAYLEAARAEKKSTVSAISLAWAASSSDIKNIQIIVADDKNSCAIKTSSYEEFLDGNAKFICHETPWDFQVAINNSELGAL